MMLDSYLISAETLDAFEVFVCCRILSMNLCNFLLFPQTWSFKKWLTCFELLCVEALKVLVVVHGPTSHIDFR